MSWLDRSSQDPAAFPWDWEFLHFTVNPGCSVSQNFLSVSQNFLSLCHRISSLYPKISCLCPKFPVFQNFLCLCPKIPSVCPRIPSPCASQSVIPSFLTDCSSWSPFPPFPGIIPGFLLLLGIINSAHFGEGPGRSHPGVGWGSKWGQIPKKRECRDQSLEQQLGMGSRS